MSNQKREDASKWQNMYSAAEIGLKRDILEGDNTAELRPYHRDAGEIPVRGRDNAADRARG
jgi:hypothetical protein